MAASRTRSRLPSSVVLRILVLAGSFVGSSGPWSGGVARSMASVCDSQVVWIGHVESPTGLPGTPGGYGPHQVGRGLAIPGVNPNGMWTWDHPSSGVDSLQGWWPIVRPYAITDGLTLGDHLRPWWALDYGNQANYAIPQGLKRTFGVVGVWHRDDGSLTPHPSVPAATPAWTPLSGSHSAWAGLRAHGDAATLDPLTGNPFNQSILEFNGLDAPSGGVTARNFPGYGDQWDQMLYRDVVLSDGASVSFSYAYETNLVSGHETAAATRVGWFLMDPQLAPIGAGYPSYPHVPDGNFISSSAFDGVVPDLAPEDSFMVYVGVPVDDAAITYTDGTQLPVADPLRRWFSEVLAIDGWTPGAAGVGDAWPATLIQLVSLSGASAGVASFTLPNAQIQPILDAQSGLGGKVRVVFRVKTNRGWSDEDFGVHGGSSGGRGAAIVDDVVINGWAASNGDFESPGAIDNSLGTSPLTAWKSTGRPPQATPHVHDVATLPFEDEDGQLGSPLQPCAMEDGVLSFGDQDDSDRLPAGFGSVRGEQIQSIVSPTINLKAAGSGPGLHNGMGIDQEIADASLDYFLRYEVYLGDFWLENPGLAVTVGVQCYPALQPGNGAPCWGEIRTLQRPIVDWKDCVQILEPLRANGLIQTSNSSGIPDSMRVLLVIGSNSSTDSIPGTVVSRGYAYIDNVSVGMLDCSCDDPLDPESRIAGIEIAQMDFYGTSEPAIDYTEWGDFGVSLKPGFGGVRYLNVLLSDIAGTTTDWPIRNMLIPPTADRTDTTTIWRYFDLAGIGVTRGTPQDSLRYQVCVSPVHVDTLPSLPGTPIRAAMSHKRHEASGGASGAVDVSSNGLAAPARPKSGRTKHPPVWEFSAWRDMPRIEEEPYECGPGSATRSLIWLRRDGALALKPPHDGKSEDVLATDLKDWLLAHSDFSVPEGGVDPGGYLKGKLSLNDEFGTNIYNKFIVDNQNTKITSGTLDATKNFEHQKRLALTRGKAPTMAFIKAEIDAGEDVEIMYGRYKPNGDRIDGHWVTLQQYAVDPINKKHTLYMASDFHQGVPNTLPQHGLREFEFDDSRVVGENPDHPATLSYADTKNGVTQDGMRVECIVSESPRAPGALAQVGNEHRLTWNGHDEKWVDDVIVRPGKTVRIGMGTTRTGVEHPMYEPREVTNTTGSPLRVKRYLPPPEGEDIKFLPAEKVDAEKSAKSVGGVLRQNSPWRVDSLGSMPAGDYRVPVLGATGAQGNARLYTAVNYDLYITQNPLGFGVPWAAGLTLQDLGANVVNGQISGLGGIYFATEEFVVDSLSATGFVPENGAAGWLDSGAFEAVHGPIEVAFVLERGFASTGVDPSRANDGENVRGIEIAPNPVTGRMALSFTLSRGGVVGVRLTDIAGRVVRDLGSGRRAAGSHTIEWDVKDREGRPVGAGVYFVQLRVAGEKTSRKFIVVD